MDHDLLIKYISTLGFPICSAVALGWVTYKVLLFLASAHVEKIKKDEAELAKQTGVLNLHMPQQTQALDNIGNELELTRREIEISRQEQQKQTKLLEEVLPTVCRHESDCDSFSPKRLPKPKG